MINNEKKPESPIALFIRDFHSPTKEEKIFVQQEYERLKKILEGNIFQSGSYARFTAITPLNDLDVIWVLSENSKKQISSGDLNLGNILNDLAKKLEYEYKKLGINVKTEAQTRSVKIEFVNEDGDFTIDIVPARELEELNEFGSPIYEIPEINSQNDVDWVKTDPRGYIELAKAINEDSPNFRKTTKLLKAWRQSWKNKRNFSGIEFKLKSFHLELIVQKLISENSEMNILDLAELFFGSVSSFISEKKFPDRARNKYVDDYIDEFVENEKKLIGLSARCALVLIEQIKKENNDKELVKLFHKLVSGEEFIEAYGYNMVVNKLVSPMFYISAVKNDESNDYKSGIIKLDKGDKVKFSAKFLSAYNYTKSKITKYLYKVTNTGDQATKAKQLRGEINKNNTLNLEESAVFKGIHFVECFGVDDQTRNVLAYAICTVVIDENIVTK